MILIVYLFLYVLHIFVKTFYARIGDKLVDDQACDNQVGNGPGDDVQVCDDFILFF